MTDPALRRALVLGGVGAAAIALDAVAARAADPDPLTLLGEIESTAVTVISALSSLSLVTIDSHPWIARILATCEGQHAAGLQALQDAASKAVVSVPDAVQEPLSPATLPTTVRAMLEALEAIEARLVATVVAVQTHTLKPDDRVLVARLTTAAAQRLAEIRMALSLTTTKGLKGLPGAHTLSTTSATAGLPEAFVLTTEAVGVTPG